MSIREQGRRARPPSDVALAWVSVVRAGDQLTRDAEGVFGPHGVTGDQYNVLRILRGAGPSGLARREITARLMRRSPDTTRLLDRLERGGLIERVRGDADARLSIARITPAGRTLLDRVDPELEQVMARALAPLSGAQLAQLATLCNTLVE